MKNAERFEVIIETDGGGIDVRLLNEFLYNFRAAYAAAVLHDPGPAMTPQFDYEAAAWLSSKVDGSDWKQIAQFARIDLGRSNLEIVDIRRKNPLTIIFSGVFVALAVAVIISGGELKAGPLKVKLPPLGDGIAKLRQALGRPPGPGEG
ncbi:hypothetical protein [uncultured Xanthomonas sp.]|uniref:hypothetical protein n=1 Tax=uncultured Xanthomonas sp. TaxID=152831 RepID=UPI0025FF0FF7|nr:hypothetical protein [uncultured Xanthomonas sp.]